MVKYNCISHSVGCGITPFRGSIIIVHRFPRAHADLKVSAPDLRSGSPRANHKASLRDSRGRGQEKTIELNEQCRRGSVQMVGPTCSQSLQTPSASEQEAGI